MPVIRSRCAGISLPFLCLALCAGCGGDSENDDTSDVAGQGGGGGEPAMREGPEGCYIEANFMCDCDLDEAACTEDVGIWTSGCMSCAM